MTMPDESLRSLKRSHKFLSSLVFMRKQSFRNMSLEEFEAWRREAIGCLRHFPFDYQLDQLYAEVVCKECGECLEFSHKMDCSLKGEG